MRNQYLKSPVFFVILFVLFVSVPSRLYFAATSPAAIGPLAFLVEWLRGLAFDLAVAGVFAVPFLLASLWPRRLMPRSRVKNVLSFLTYLLIFFITGFATVSEFFFINEFHDRFNFIAVDYLVYTTEILNNIWESYPVGWILAAHLLLCGGLAYLAIKNQSRVRWPKVISILGLVLVFALQWGLTQDAVLKGVSDDLQGVTKNPIYSLFAAFRNNGIDYLKFYARMDDHRADQLANNALNTRAFRTPATAKSANPPNVMLVLMESMSSRFMKTFGSRKDLTPNLDRLAQEGLLFDHTYATGTRTVRGIEAITLSVPPTPGESIVRRPGSESLFNLGTIFRRHGYTTRFIYGGRAWFDNMQNFFESNGFTVLDQPQISPVHFSNAWGVCDEDLFDQTLERADKDFAEGHPFFHFILTTSNHRPYTYPDHRVDIPSHTGREGALKYADFAIGRFIKQAQNHPWFNNTIFIFVADHDASVAGGTRILPTDYRIPMIFYAPHLITRQRVSVRASQLDLGPTLIGLLGFSPEPRFFGQDLLAHPQGRAYLSTYEKVGYWRDDQMVILSPNREVELFHVDGETPTLVRHFTATAADFAGSNSLLDLTVSLYQTASARFEGGLMTEAASMAQH